MTSPDAAHGRARLLAKSGVQDGDYPENRSRAHPPRNRLLLPHPHRSSDHVPHTRSNHGRRRHHPRLSRPEYGIEDPPRRRPYPPRRPLRTLRRTDIPHHDRRTTGIPKTQCPRQFERRNPTPTTQGRVITAGHNHTELTARKNRHVTSHRQGRRTVVSTNRFVDGASRPVKNDGHHRGHAFFAVVASQIESREDGRHPHMLP